MENINTLTHSELSSKINSLCSTEREITAEVIRHLFELDIRGLYRDLGYSSLFAYCTTELKYSEGSAMRRISAARCLKESPEVYEKLRDGRLTLCSVACVSKVAVTKGRELLLVQAEGQSKRKVQELVAAVLPPEVPRKETIKVKHVIAKSPPPLLVAQQAATDKCYEIIMNVDAGFLELLEEAKACSGAFLAKDVIEKTLKLYVDVKSPVRRAARRKERKARSCNGVSTATRDRVFVRDGAQCTFVGSNGKRCCEKHNLQIEHCAPKGKGGGDGEYNLRLLCPAHNRLMAERVYGREKISKFSLK